AVYVVGLFVFTASSLWCGLADGVEMLILARVVQGLGAGLMTPQTMSMITRMFAPQQRGQAMAVWGATAGVASLVGRVLALVLVLRNVPRFSHRAHSFDWLGVVLSATGLFLLVFGIQEGDTYDWGTITDSLVLGPVDTRLPLSVPGLIITGAVIFAVFL